MFKHVIIHLGLHKTGTTSIQRTLRKNHNALLNNGIAYPQLTIATFKPANHSWPIINLVSDKPSLYHLNIRHRIKQIEISTSNSSNLNELQSLSSTSRTLLISAEGISNLDTPHLERLKKLIESIADQEATFEFHYFKRDIGNYITSVVQERLKGGTLEQSIFDGLNASKMSNDYLRIDALKRTFPQSIITEHSFEEACKYKRGLEQYFLEKVVGYKQSYKSVKMSNESLSAQSYELIQNYISNSNQYQEVPLSGSDYQKNIHLLSMVSGDKFRLNHRHVKGITALDNKHLLEENILSSHVKQPEDCWEKFDFNSTCKHLIIVNNECRKISLKYLSNVALNFKNNSPTTSAKIISLIITVKLGVMARSILKASKIKLKKIHSE